MITSQLTAENNKQCVNIYVIINKMTKVLVIVMVIIIECSLLYQSLCDVNYFSELTEKCR